LGKTVQVTVPNLRQRICFPDRPVLQNPCLFLAFLFLSIFYYLALIKTFLGAERVFLFMDKDTKTPTGDATVTYQDSNAALHAISMFNGQDFNGAGVISVGIATPEQKQPFAQKLVCCNFFFVGRSFSGSTNIENKTL